MEIGRCCKSGLSLLPPENPLTSSPLVAVQLQKASAEPTKCLKAGKGLQGCPKLEVRELGIYTPLLSVTGCGLSLEGDTTLGKLFS